MLRILFAILVILMAGAGNASAQESVQAYRDSLMMRAIEIARTDSLTAVEKSIVDQTDSIIIDGKKYRDWSKWKPDVKRAMWMAIVIPGGGQIYNRKYWKLPLVYGGFLGCIYAWRWNGQMYKDYRQAYMDIMDNDPTTNSYESFLHLGSQITDSNKERYQNLFQKRKDRFRRYRDMSVFVMIGVYALSVIDAYVDASLSSFDISDDLSLHVSPGVMPQPTMYASRSPFKSNALGLSCSLDF